LTGTGSWSIVIPHQLILFKSGPVRPERAGHDKV
jgi:hypothetical protein